MGLFCNHGRLRLHRNVSTFLIKLEDVQQKVKCLLFINYKNFNITS